MGKDMAKIFRRGEHSAYVRYVSLLANSLNGSGVADTICSVAAEAVTGFSFGVKFPGGHYDLCTPIQNRKLWADWPTFFAEGSNFQQKSKTEKILKKKI